MYKFLAIVGATMAITVAPNTPAATKNKDIGKQQVDPWVYEFSKKNIDVFPIRRPAEAPKKPLAWGEKPVKDDFVPAPKPAPLVPKPGEAEAEAVKAAAGEAAAKKSAEAEAAGKEAAAIEKKADAAAAAAPAAPAAPAL